MKHDLQLAGSGFPAPVPLPTSDLLDDSPLPVARVGLAIAVLFFVIFLGWAAVARLDAAAIGSGQVTVVGNRQTVQHREGGVVGALNVREGQHVKAGQVLIQLTAPDVVAQERALAEGVINLEAQQARLEAEITGAPVQPPASFASYVGENRLIAERATRLQLSQFDVRRGSLAAASGVGQQKRAEINQQIGGYTAQAAAADRQRASLSEQLANTRKLAAEGFASDNTVRQLERAVSQLDASKADFASRAAAAREEISGVSGQDVQNRRRYQEDSSAVLRDTLFQLNELKPKWLAAREQLAQTQIRAPVSGRVVGLAIFTRGGVLAPGERILDIVPDAAPLVIRAQFSPSDIDGVVEGREAEIRFLSIHERDLPILMGRVRSVSADTLRDERTGQAYFTADVAVLPSQLMLLRSIRGSDTGVRPGVPVQVFIGLRRRTALQYLLDPLTEAFSRSFRER
jgi:HlyD family secretion protein